LSTGMGSETKIKEVLIRPQQAGDLDLVLLHRIRRTRQISTRRLNISRRQMK
jgi:hypothetical protein